MDLGSVKVKCVKAGGDTLAVYSNLAVSEDQVLDLLDQSVDPRIRFMDYYSALNAVKDTGFELAAKIVAGDYELLETREPPLSQFQEG